MYKLYLEGLDMDEVQRIRYPMYNVTMDDLDALELVYHVMDGWDDEIDDIKLIEAIIARYNSDVEQIKIEEELTKRPFQVGDIVTGIEGHHYAYTTEDAIMQVVEVLPYEEISVKILKHKTLPSQEGSEYEVEEKYFREVE